jgi:hypothetical protein
VDHLSSKTFRWVPGSGLDTTAWQLQVTVDGPASAAAPVAGVVRVLPDGSSVREEVALDAAGVGRTTVPFNVVETGAVHVVLGNASTRYACERGGVWACEGDPRDDGSPVRLTLAVVPQP